MAIETINGTLQLTRLTNESAEYVARRDELSLAEIELMRQGERVAAMRRHLLQERWHRLADAGVQLS